MFIPAKTNREYIGVDAHNVSVQAAQECQAGADASYMQVRTESPYPAGIHKAVD
jgi:hypothetical protein